MEQATIFATLKTELAPCTIEQTKAMKVCKHKLGVTLVEMLIVVAIIALLATMVISMAARIGHQAKEQLTESTIAILAAALGQFQDYGYQYKVQPSWSDKKRDFYLGLDFPLDCNGFNDNELKNELEGVLDVSVLIAGGSHEDKYSGSEAMYFFLNRVPASRETLDKIDNSLITNEGSDKQDMKITVGSEDYPLRRIIDPWGKTLRYDYYDETDTPAEMKKSKRAFPVISSAGPDGKFGTGDDITSR